jgi:hypothetical protein
VGSAGRNEKKVNAGERETEACAERVSRRARALAVHESEMFEDIFRC